MASPDLTGLTSAVNDLNDNQNTTNELLEKLVEHFTEDQLKEPEPEKAGGPGAMKVFGRALLKTVAFLTAANAALTVFSRTLTKQAAKLGGAVEREVATQILTREMWGGNFDTLGKEAFEATVANVVEGFGIVPNFDAATPGMAQMGELKETYGIDISNLIDPIRMMLATGAVGSFNEAMDEIVKTREKLAARGLNVNKALKEIRNLPDLVARFGSTANEELLSMIASSQKLGISARSLQDSVLSLAGKGFGSMIEEVANLQTIMPGLTIDFNELAGIATSGTLQDQLDFLGKTFEKIDLGQVPHQARLGIEGLFGGLKWEDILKAAGQEDLIGAMDEITQTTPEETFMAGASLFDKASIAFSGFVGDFGDDVSRMMGAPLVESMTKMLTVFGGLWAMFRVSKIVSPGGGLGAVGGLLGWLGRKAIPKVLGAGGRAVAGAAGSAVSGLSGLGMGSLGNASLMAGTGTAAATVGMGVAGLTGGLAIGEGINRLVGGRSFKTMAENRRERKFSEERTENTNVQIQDRGFSSEVELQQRNEIIRKRIGQLMDEGESRSSAVQQATFGTGWHDPSQPSGSVVEPTGESDVEQLINVQTVHEQTIETPGPVEEIMEAITPTDEPKPADVIEQQKINTDSITSRLDTLLIATNNLNDTIRDVEIAFPTEMKLGGDTVEFAGLIQRKAFDAVLRG